MTLLTNPTPLTSPELSRATKIFAACACGLILIPPGELRAADIEIEELVVTAQKREEALLDVPIAITAFGEDFLLDRQATDFKDLIRYTPGYSGSTPDGFLDSVAVRGITSNAFGVGAEPSIGIFLDGIYQTRAGTVPSLIDVQRVEMIKGPQGTLFGRNTSSGTVNVISNLPEDDVNGEVSVAAGSFDRVHLYGVANTPLSDSLFARAALLHESEDGHIRNQLDGDKLGGYETTAGRIALRYAGFEAADITASAYYEDRDHSASIYRALGTPGAFDEVQSDLGAGNKDESEIAGITVGADVALADGTLVFTTGYKRSNYTYVEDFDGSADLIDEFGRDQEASAWSQEVRFVSDTGRAIRWFAGVSAYGEDVRATFYDRSDQEILCITYLEDSCANGLAPDPFTPTPGGQFESSTSRGDYSGWGVFAEMSFDVSERIELTLGGRYTVDERDFSLFVPEPEGDLGAFFIYGFVTDTPLTGSDDWQNVSPRALIEFQASDTLMLFASYSQGYKAGGFESFTVRDNDFAGEVLGPDAELALFEDELVSSYEVGAKGKLLDGRLRYSASTFYYDYEDLQQTFFVGAISVTDNVGEAQGQGLELDLQWYLTDNLDFALAASYLDTELGDLPADLCDNCEGNKLPFAPELSLSAIMNMRYPVAIGEIFASLEWSWVDEQYFDVANTPEIINGSFATTDVRVGIAAPSDNWSASAYVRNAFDEDYYQWGFAEEEPIPATQVTPAQGRTVGLEFRYRY